MLVRDGPEAGLEVLMVQRHHQIEFASGALVFPGGKVEEGDLDPAWERHVFGWDAVEPRQRALRICAVREAFEESGILVARHAGDADWEIGTRTASARGRVARGEARFLDLVQESELKLDLGAMAMFAHWITPPPAPKRFDTTFYLMTAPSDQLAACDGWETVDAMWTAPEAALALGRAGERTVLFPTRLNLQLLAASGTVAEALAAVRARTVRTVLPTVGRGEAGPTVWIEPDLGYGVVPPQPF